MSEARHIISALVTNESGVLTRLSGLFARRCYNIDSLSACTTEDPSLSRLTLVVTGDDGVIAQLILQLSKLPDCKHIDELDADNAVKRELLLIKVKADPTQRAELETVCRTYDAKIVDLSPDSVVIELTGKPAKISGFIDVLKNYAILELARTGLTAIERGSGTLNDEENKTETV